VSERDEWNRKIIEEFRTNAGKVGGPFEGVPILLLHHRGAKSGTERVSPLAYRRDGDNLVVFASKGGAPTNPGWYENLVAHPEAKIQVWDKIIPVTARTGTPADKKRVWPKMAEQWPGYNDYQKGTKRDIPVVLLKPRS